MEINYQETSKDLLTRIDIHEKYGSANIDQWTTDLLKPQAGMDILDIGCGAGKLCFLFDDYTKGTAKITGGDFSEELLDKARARNSDRGTNINFQFLDFNKPFDFMLQTWTLHLVKLIECFEVPTPPRGNPADDFSCLVHCLRTSKCSMTSSKKRRMPPSHPCPVLPALRAIFSTPLTKSLQKLNYIDSKIISPSRRLRRSLNMSALR